MGLQQHSSTPLAGIRVAAHRNAHCETRLGVHNVLPLQARPSLAQVIRRSSMSQPVRVLLTLIATLFGVIVGIIAGILTVVDGGSLASAVTLGGAGCAGASIFALTVIAFLFGFRQ
ncbi:hypothetical protein [Nocardia xishanensis]